MLPPTVSSSSFPATLHLTLAGGGVLQISVRASRRARRLRLVSGLAGVHVVVPPACRQEDLEEFVSSKKDWIIRTSQYYAKLRQRCGVKQQEHDTPSIYFLGSRYRFHVVKDRHESATVSEAMKVITFHVTDRRTYKQKIREWYREQTAQIIAERLPLISARLNLQYNKVSIKNQRSRWGSCSRKRNLNFNLLLSAAPPEVIDYVIIHELMHLLRMDHSRKFWSLVESADPEYKKHRSWLTDYAPVIKIG